MGEEVPNVFSAGRKGRADDQNEGDEGKAKEHVGENEGVSWGVDDNEQPTGPFLLSASGGRAEFDLLPSRSNTDMGSLLADCAGAECWPSPVKPRPISGALGWAQEAPAAYPLKLTREPETDLAVHLQVESDTEMAYGGSNNAGVVTHAPESKFGHRGNVVGETEEDDIAAADWLDVSHALLAYTEQGAMAGNHDDETT